MKTHRRMWVEHTITAKKKCKNVKATAAFIFNTTGRLLYIHEIQKQNKKLDKVCIILGKNRSHYAMEDG